jgi:methylglyoxal synthase
VTGLTAFVTGRDCRYRCDQAKYLRDAQSRGPQSKATCVIPETSAKHIALIAHDQMKPGLTDWVEKNAEILRPHRFTCTATTGGFISARLPDLTLNFTKSGPLGGDQQIGALIATEEIDLLIFFIDPLSPHPHDVDVKALTRLAVVYDIPMASSRATADLIVQSGFFVI